LALLFANLFLANGYRFCSGLINFGDFAAVIDGLRPAWFYRIALVVVGGFGYRSAFGLRLVRLLRLGLFPSPMRGPLFTLGVLRAAGSFCLLPFSIRSALA